MNGIGDWLIPTIQHYGPIALFVCMTLETLGLPLPGESALIAAAAAAGASEINIVWVAIAGFAGAVLGDNIGYLIGRHIGRRVIVSYGSKIGITDERYKRAEGKIERHGFWIVIVSRFVVLLRQLNGLVAGSAGMPWPKFLLANVIGAVLWVGAWCTAAYFLGRAADRLPALLHSVKWISIVAIPIVILGVIALFYFDRRRERNGSGKIA
ncbi:DedA family protein [Pararhizobium mangrovi]|uniref:DedA family protein n=1 Tax=Pararhizobium mangrovi TaxID=2590452 RepID=A0A506U3J1_9HYPH|nr:DedA family protein [Pararhizobium mangrovi]TPW26457.1 DedA family protein [Pararhizobium mangrovi]